MGKSSTIPQRGWLYMIALGLTATNALAGYAALSHIVHAAALMRVDVDGPMTSLPASAWQQHWQVTALLLIVAMVCDGLDGPIARMSGCGRRLGAWLDAVADALSFGLVPMVMVTSWQPSLWPWAMLFGIAGVSRLSRHAWCSASTPSGARFVGLPLPTAAMGVVAMLLVLAGPASQLSLPTEKTLAASALTSLAIVMVIPLRYPRLHPLVVRSFATRSLGRAFAWLMIVVLLVWIATRIGIAAAGGMLVLGYVSVPIIGQMKRGAARCRLPGPA